MVKHFLIPIFFISVTFLHSATALANCTNPDAPTGKVILNSTYDVFQGCTASGQWMAFHSRPPRPQCPGTPGAGDEGCAMPDGSIYAGLSPDGNVPMYTTAADESNGAHWGTYNFNTGSTSNVTGRANSADVYAHVQAGDGIYNPDDGYTPNASVLCEELSAHGHTDWYLPAQDELNVLYTNRAAIGGFNTSGSFTAGYYWSSTELDGTQARFQRFSDGYQFNNPKDNGLTVRCVRR